MATKDNQYIEGLGRRKSASARVRLTPAKEQVFVINDKPLTDYFYSDSLIKGLLSVFETEGISSNYQISAKVSGGGLSSQAEAVRLGIARALVKEDEHNRPALKKDGFLKRDPRSKERKKFGLLKARRRGQWSKR